MGNMIEGGGLGKVMATWYKSGLEGYCKAAAELTGEPSNAEAWGRFCNDFLKDRDVTKPDMASRTWSMSRERQGNSNRLMKFELAWLGYHANSYAKQKTAGKSASEKEQLAARNEAIAECEVEAIRACVDSIMVNGGEVYNLLPGPSAASSFAARFHASVLPAIERGFTSEGYRASDIKGYSHVLDELANRNLFDEGSFRDFCEALAAGLIYGPSHPLALKRPLEATDYYIPERQCDDVSDSQVRVTQLFSSDLSSVGYSEVYGKDTAVFFGRCTDLKEYLRKCHDLYGVGNSDLMLALESSGAVVYPISGKHTYTGNTHGVLAYVGEGWYYYDLESTNGTSCARKLGVLSGAEAVEIDGLIRITGGERLQLGAPMDADDEMLYRGATTVLVSFCIDEGEDF